MVKQKKQRNWFQNTKSSRHVRGLADARLLLRPSRPKRGHSEYVCTMCGEKGALLACIKCLKLFHLVCIGATPLCLPLSEWACTSCSQDYQNALLTSLDKLVMSQNTEKQALLRKISNKLNKVQKNTKLRDFEYKHPELVKHGQIQYPIDDELLWSKPKLHQLSVVKPPICRTFAQSNEVCDDLIYICDFSHTFQGLINTPPMKCESLLLALSTQTETFLSKQLHIALIKPLVELMLKNEAFRKAGPMLNYLIYKSRKIVTLSKFFEYSYLTFLENIFRTDIWKDLIEDFDKELLYAFHDFSFVDNYFTLPVVYKVKLLVLLTVILLDTKMFNEECTKRIDLQGILSRELNEITSAIRHKKHSDCKAELEERSEKIKVELKNTNIRTVNLGFDRFYKEFYFFQWDTSKLFVKTSEKVPNWGFYDKKSEIEEFMSSLSEKGTRESQLLLNLESLLQNKFLLRNEVESTSSEEDEDKKHTLTVYTLVSLKTWLKALHTSIAETLRVSVSTPYLDSIDSSSLLDLFPLIITFHQAFAPFSDTSKVLEKVAGLWDFSDLHSIWEISVKECENLSELYMCVHLLTHMVEKFNQNNKVIEVVESAYNIARRSYRIERLNKMKKEVPKEQDLQCYVCGQLGYVACCDVCPKVAHFECIGISQLPDGEWHCPICVEKASNIRVTRSKQIKY